MPPESLARGNIRGNIQIVHYVRCVRKPDNLDDMDT
jgi:hypothetical protein